MSRSPNRMLGVILGVIYLLIGIFGFFLTSSTDFLSTNGPLLIGLFEINSLHNLVHLVLGAGLLLAGLLGALPARIFNGLIGAAFLLLGIAGLFLANGSSPFNVLAFNAADNVLHFATAVVLLAVGLGADKAVSGPKSA